jgi:hypothetical protein
MERQGKGDSRQIWSRHGSDTSSTSQAFLASILSFLAVFAFVDLV